MNRKKIIVAGNGPSAYADAVREWLPIANDREWTRVFRTNYFFLRDGDPLDYSVSDWFVCEDVADCRAVRAACRFGGIRPKIWIPGVNKRGIIPEIETNHLAGLCVRLQRTFPRLPDACRWDRDLAPERPLMGSFAIAVAVGMQPDELFLCGHDLFFHSSGDSHAGSALESRDWQADFNSQYLGNVHRNHRLSGDVNYIRAALSSYRGKVSCVGTVLGDLFRDEFPSWTWIDG
jgi:hypothetical protein